MPKVLDSQGFIESLLAATEPKSLTFKVAVAPGLELEFRTITDYAETVKIRQKAQAFIANFATTCTKKEWAPFAGTPDEVLGLAFYMAETNVGSPKLGMHDFLRISKSRANVFDALRDRLNEGQYAVVEKTEDEAIEEAKNESGGTPDGATA